MDNPIPVNERKKIAVIGGGMSALSAIYQITLTENWQSKYDITVYQKGWRIGGKGASGRNPDFSNRIEEHGLHIWFGFYDNAFNQIKDCYNKLGPTTSPLKTFDDAFKPHSFIPLEEFVDGEWETWGLEFPENDMKPGGDHELLPLWQYVKMTLEVIHQYFSGQEKVASPHGCLGFFVRLFRKAFRWTEPLIEGFIISESKRLLKGAIDIIEEHGENIKHRDHEGHQALHDHLEGIGHWLKNLLGDILFHWTTARRLFIILDLTITCIKGILRDGLLTEGFDVINDIEFMDWLKMHGAADITVQSTLITALYDVGFAYTDGDLTKRNYEAGSALRIIFRLGLTYRGAFMWKMQAGMGDTIFTPIYKVLSRFEPSDTEGGITFKFFHKINNVQLSGDQKSIERINVGIQAHVKDNKTYDPFVVINDLPCWPDRPNYDQLVEGDELQEKGINLESFWTPWENPESIVLEKGKDFDLVILGTPIGTLPHICPELIAANPAWARMVETVQTTQTQAYQLWLKPDLNSLGWTDPSPVMTSYEEPVDTWADMSQLIERESWPEGIKPGSIAYFCGVMPDATIIPPANNHWFPADQHDRVKKHLLHYLNNYTGFIWPKGARTNDQNGLDLELLIDPANGNGIERVDAQFWRANIDPSERYTLTNVGSSKFRLETDKTGFDNLFITGDWIQNFFNYGCIEACVMSGMLAARAVTGVEIPIVGLKDAL